jgi:hypothetical protein
MINSMLQRIIETIDGNNKTPIKCVERMPKRDDNMPMHVVVNANRRP